MNDSWFCTPPSGWMDAFVRSFFASSHELNSGRLLRTKESNSFGNSVISDGHLRSFKGQGANRVHVPDLKSSFRRRFSAVICKGRGHWSRKRVFARSFRFVR